MKLKLALAGLTMTLVGCYSAEEVHATHPSDATKNDTKVEHVADTMSMMNDTSHLTSTFYFAYDKSSIDETNKKLLLAVADFLVKHPKENIKIIGHTDVRGTREYNHALGQRRADAIAAYLMEHGVKAEQIKVISHGKENPLSTTENDQAQALNRRVEIIFVK
jgi:peptidoglycan-associated lipoprotein